MGVAVQDRARTDRPFVGRTDELAMIEECVAAPPRVLLIEGEAGSGKTTLLRRALESLPTGTVVLRAEADELATDLPMAVIEQLAPLSAKAPFAAGLELLDRFAAAQGDETVVVAVEDLHWADDASRQALLTAARRLDEDRVVLIVTTRPGNPDDGWERLRADPDRCRVLTVGALSVDEVAQLAEQVGVGLAPAAAARLHHHTQGHPLYVRTLLTELDPTQLSAPDGDLPVPRSLASTTVSRLAGLAPDARDLAQALAVVNRRTPLDVVGRIAGLDHAAPALEGLLSTGFVAWWPSEVDTPVAYTHPLHRTAVYRDLSPTRRRELHHAASLALDSGSALSHRVAAADGPDDELATELIDAAAGDRRAGALSRSVRHLLWASNLCADRARAEDLLLDAVGLLVSDGQIARARALRDQVGACREGPKRSLVLGQLTLHAGDGVGAERWFRDVGARAHVGDTQLQADALTNLAMVCTIQGRSDEGVAAAEQALALQPRDPGLEREVWQALAWSMAARDGAVVGLERLRERLPHPAASVLPADVDLLVVRGALAYYAGRPTEAVPDLQAVGRLVHQGAVAVQLPRAHLHLAQALVQVGDWDGGLIHAHISQALADADDRVWMSAQVSGALSGLQAARGEWAAAEANLERAQAAADAVGSVEASFLTQLAGAALAQARDDQDALVDALLPLADGDVPMLSSLGWWSTLVVALAARGDHERAARHLDRLDRAAEERHLDLHARILGAQAQVHVAAGRPDDAQAAFTTALDRLADDDPLLDRALLHQAFGRLLSARGDRRQAVDQLRAAHDLLAAVHAAPYLERVAADLDAAGIRSDPVGGRSPLDLTDRERDVVALVARGMTNREAAAELYVSEKAVEYHLRNVFPKLGITSRRQLRDHPALT